MTANTKVVNTLSVVLGGSVLLLLPFGNRVDLVDGSISGSLIVFYVGACLLAGAFILMKLASGFKTTFRLGLPDLFFLLLIGCVFLTYDYSFNPAKEKLLFVGQLLFVWFILRSMMSDFPRSRYFFLFVLLLTGIIEAFLGIGQLYNIYPSNHALFGLTGTFMNPGPYSGYLATLLPVSVGVILKLSYCKKSNWKSLTTIFYYMAWACTILILLVLPAGMSRSAWIAAIVSCLFVAWCYRGGWRNIRGYFRRSPKTTVSLLIGCLLFMGVSAFYAYELKRDSADGRLLMWKVSSMAISENPWKGEGLGMFPATYSQAQANYFSTDLATTSEKYVAGTPEYAFNEYLQIGLEHGVIALILFVLWLGSVCYYGIKNKRYEMVGGVLSLAIFAFSSYPLQIPAFWMVLIYLSVCAISAPRREPAKKFGFLNYKYPILVPTMAVASLCIYHGEPRRVGEVYEEWAQAKVFYNFMAYDKGIEKYSALYPNLYHRHDFLFEYAQCLSKCGYYTEAIEHLERANTLSSDPMINYMIAKNRQEMGEYQLAEEQLRYSLEILPERIYPYFLLTKLYFEPEFFQRDKFYTCADSVLYKKAKVETTAIREMREEVKRLLVEIENIIDINSDDENTLTE